MLNTILKAILTWLKDQNNEEEEEEEGGKDDNIDGGGGGKDDDDDDPSTMMIAVMEYHTSNKKNKSFVYVYFVILTFHDIYHVFSCHNHRSVPIVTMPTLY